MPEQYIYAVARVRGKELKLLSAPVMDSLVAAPGTQEALRILADHGWGNGEEAGIDEMLAEEREKTWAFISELVPDMSVFDVFLYANDYHNLKAAVKETAMMETRDSVFIGRSQTTVDADLIRNAVRDHDFSALPEEMAQVAREALDVLLHTGDGQLSDIMIDRAALVRILEAGKKSDNEILQMYGELTVACADIKAAIRASLMKKDRAFLDKALAPCDSLDIADLAQAAADSTDAVYEYLGRTRYSDAVSELRKSPSAFERWCDNLMIEKIRPEIHHPFTIGPLAAYILARENEIKCVRMILSGKINDLSVESIRERVRETYV
ncbi:MAG: V-type ATPase subunit [Lachnospiraceae bacterium]|nr:V-type ATPase subunit [Lachnospiraceae bacterium]